MREKIVTFAFALACLSAAAAQDVPRTWDEEAILSMHLPVAATGKKAVPVSASFYKRMPVLQIFRSYPVYHPDHEPDGYQARLARLDPEIVFKTQPIRTEQDWLRAGRHVFEAPIAHIPAPVARELLLENPEWWDFVMPPLTEEGALPFVTWSVRKKGKVEFGFNSCATCHTRIMPDGSVVLGAQGNFRFDAAAAFLWHAGERLEFARQLMHELYGMPEVEGLEAIDFTSLTLDEIVELQSHTPAGVFPRHGTNPLSPVQIPDLIGVRERRYLDRTGLVQHRGTADLMRYAALNQGAEKLSDYDGFVPSAGSNGELPAPESLFRYSDAQLYALAQFVYSLEPPTNPNPFDDLAKKGQKVFAAEGCAKCHKPPLYTNNRLVAVPGFDVPAEHRELYDIMRQRIGTDPTLSLTTRRGTGYYKVPSLLGVWYRGPFTHDGSIATLEDWFDPERLENDYVPTGWRGPAEGPRPILGHEFGLDLSAENRKALIAFLMTL